MSEFYINEFPRGVNDSRKEYVTLEDCTRVPGDGLLAEIELKDDRRRILPINRDEEEKLGLNKEDIGDEFKIYIEKGFIRGIGRK